MSSLDEILADYESGLYTNGETVSRLIGLAVRDDPKSFMPKLPDKSVERVRHAGPVADPPLTVEDVFLLRGGSREEREDTFRALWALNRYFQAEGGLRPNTSLERARER